MRSLLYWLPLVATACASTASFSTSSFGSSGSSSGGDGQVTIPNVFKLKRDAAIAALRRAGVQGDISEDSSLCGSVVEGKLIEVGEVCYQHPPAGRVQGGRLAVTIRIQTEDPRRGNVGTHNEWRLMPNLIGKTYEQAVAELHRAGFTQDDRLQHVWADETSCKPLVVCRQYPDAMERSGINSDRIVYVGQDPAAKLRHTPTDGSPATRDSTSTSPPSTERTPPTETTRVDPPKSDAKKEDEALPPLFGAPAPKPTTKPSTTPATSSAPASTDEKKHWGGNGAPPYRDSANVPHGPGGPIYMGKAAPCTNKIDHCLRPGVWFAADNVVAGKLFRGTPVFEFDNKWWTWRGELAEQKFLFRTKVAERMSEISVGKPVVVFVEESGRKWLDNEHDMLTSSRWTIGVVDSIGADTLTLKGWGTVSLESVRVIVEEKHQ